MARKKTNKEFLNEVEIACNGEYTVCEQYINANTPITFEHLKCGHKYKVKPNHFLHGRRCPHCNKSKNEKVIAAILDEMNVQYIEEYRICKNPVTNRYLPYDFAIFDNDQLIAFIEFDGKQHYIEAWGGIKELKETQYRDKLKNNFAVSIGVPLIRIPFNQNLESSIKNTIQALRNKKMCFNNAA